MKPINEDKHLNPPYPLEQPRDLAALPARGFPNLRTKFVLFFSFILAIACSTLSWYYVEERRTAMTDDLQQLGTVLLTSVVRNEHFQYAGLVGEDRATLQQFIEGVVAVKDVVYVVVTGADGNVLARHTKEHANLLPALCGPWIILYTRTARLRNSSSNRQAPLL